MTGLVLALSIGAGSFAHAMETQEITIETTSGTITMGADHRIGQGDFAPDDAGKGYPHHHGGCHADHVGAPARCAKPDGIVMMNADVFVRVAATRPNATADPALRPPQA